MIERQIGECGLRRNADCNLVVILTPRCWVLEEYARNARVTLYSSARDLANLTRILLNNPTFASIVGTRTKTIYTEAKRPILLANTNNLLANPDYHGVKTGFTNGAGECLITLTGDAPKEILTVLLGSTNRFGESDTINSWLNTHFVW